MRRERVRGFRKCLHETQRGLASASVARAVTGSRSSVEPTGNGDNRDGAGRRRKQWAMPRKVRAMITSQK